MDSPSLENIESFPRWRVLLRPQVHAKDRVKNHHELEQILRRCHVSWRGWDFPLVRIDEQGWTRDDNCTQGAVNYSSHIEMWRVCLSGQFAFKAIIREYLEERSGNERADEPIRKFLSIDNWVWNVTEVCEFAYRYTSLLGDVESWLLSVELSAIKGFHIGGWRGDSFTGQTKECHLSHIVMEELLPPASTVRSYDATARSMVQTLVAPFDFRVGEDRVRELQAKLMSLGIGRDQKREVDGQGAVDR